MARKPSRNASSSPAREGAPAVHAWASETRLAGTFGGVDRSASSAGSEPGVAAASSSSPGAATALSTS
jgi:hypothetical protein